MKTGVGFALIQINANHPIPFKTRWTDATIKPNLWGNLIDTGHPGEAGLTDAVI
jgi:hypothetical protein